jgi:hypothetical protein
MAVAALHEKSNFPDVDNFTYTVSFPFFRRTGLFPSLHAAEQSEPAIRIDISENHVYFPRPTTTFIEVPKDVLKLDNCSAVVQHLNIDLDLERLVKELIRFGCGKGSCHDSELPVTLSSGARLINFVSSDAALSFDNEVGFKLASYDMTEPGRLLPDNRDMGISTMFNSDSPATFMTATSPTSIIYNVGYSPMSNFASPASFMSGNSPASFVTAGSTYASPAYNTGNNGLSPAMRIETIREEEPLDPSIPAPLRKLRNDYYSHLHEQDIVQPFDKELNWSGKGQHVVYMQKEDVPLSVLSYLGASMTAKVDQCFAEGYH